MHNTVRLSIAGLVEVFSIINGVKEGAGAQKNTVLYSGMDLFGLLLSGSQRPINGMYFEFENGTPAADIVAPSFVATDDVSYYLGLSGPRDYIRAPAGLMTAPVASSPQYRTNRITFSGQSAHATGTRGLPFSATDGTVVFGAAMVSMGENPEDDIVYARTYFAPENRKPKQDMMQVGLNWTTTIYHPEDPQ